MQNFCTLFDKNYLYKGLTLYSSLQKYSDDFHLWILCMDDITFSILQKMKLKNVSLITHKDFENEQLIKAKKERSVAEYSWTSTASLCWYMLDKIKSEESITYLDADMFFFSNPKNIFDEINEASIAIVEHRLKGNRKNFEKYVGKYNVGWVSFKKDKHGLAACEWWKDKVLNWCFARFENGRIGDQHYLNDWTNRFTNVHVIKHLGADVAPWNINNEKISTKNKQIFIADDPLIFYHFHSFVLINENKFLPAPAYHIPRMAKKHIYTEYFDEIKKNIKLVHSIDTSFHFGFKNKYLKSFIAQLILNNEFIYYFYIKYACYKLEKSYA